MIDIMRTMNGRYGKALPYVGLALAVAVVYADVYPNGFLLDDQALIITDKYLQSWKYLPDIFTHTDYSGAGENLGFYRPIAMLVNLVLYQMFGLSTVAFHTLNIAVHTLNAGLVYRLGRKLGFSAAGTFAATLLWAVHPLHVESIAYMSATRELLYVMFILLGLLALLPDFTPRRTALAALCFLFALGCKETAIVFPALAAACLFAVNKNRCSPKLYIRTWPLWLMAGLYAVMHTLLKAPQMFFADAPDQAAYSAHILVRIFTSLATLPAYMSLILYPTHLHMDRPFDIFLSPWSWQVLGGAVLVCAALLQMGLGRGRRGIALSFGIFWFGAALSPATGILIPVVATVYEHWMYLPTIGLFLGVMETAAQYCRAAKVNQVLPIAFIALAALLLGAKTMRQNTVWHDPVIFYQNIFDCQGYPNHAWPDLGIYYLNHDEPDKAVKYFKLALQFPARPIIPPYIIHLQLAFAYLNAHSDSSYIVTPDAVMQALPHSTHVPEAIDELKQALNANPHPHFAYGLLWMIYKWQGKPEEAAFYYNQMVQNPL